MQNELISLTALGWQASWMRKGAKQRKGLRYTKPDEDFDVILYNIRWPLKDWMILNKNNTFTNTRF